VPLLIIDDFCLKPLRPVQDEAFPLRRLVTRMGF